MRAETGAPPPLVEVGQEADPEDRDEYRAENMFWVPKEARWEFLQMNAKQPTIGKLLDDAMTAIERDNPTLNAFTSYRCRSQARRILTGTSPTSDRDVAGGS